MTDDVNTAPSYGCVGSCFRWRLMQPHSNSLPRRPTKPSSITRWPCPAVSVKKTKPSRTYRVAARGRAVWRMVRVLLSCDDDDVHSPYPPPVEVFPMKADAALQTNGEHGLRRRITNVPDIQIVSRFFNTGHNTTNSQHKQMTQRRTYEWKRETELSGKW